MTRSRTSSDQVVEAEAKLEAAKNQARSISQQMIDLASYVDESDIDLEIDGPFEDEDSTIKHIEEIRKTLENCPSGPTRSESGSGPVKISKE